VLAYRDFYYPLNVFMHILTAEEGDVPYLHYALFEDEGESLATAQERSTELLLSRLPSPPARLLEAGIGLGTTLARLTAMGYDIEGLTPDDKQIAVARARHGDAVRIHQARFEDFTSERPYDAVFFQESSQYIPAEALFRKAAELTRRVVVLDEFAVRPEGALHQRDAFLEAASRHGFRVVEELDLSEKAAPTIDYFNVRYPRHRERLIQDLDLTAQQVDELIEGGFKYRQAYRDGVYAYRMMDLVRD
jgi:2-polyprenyl-3-methyl-5-hydroxy-6-metoxy-1,4-benzoquinol methylase